jgi:hypothetical protein
MIINLRFSVLYKKSQLYLYAIHITTYLHLAIDFWDLNILKLYCEFQKFQGPQILNYECFSYVDGKLSSFTFFSHQFLKI